MLNGNLKYFGDKAPVRTKEIKHMKIEKVI